MIEPDEIKCTDEFIAQWKEARIKNHLLSFDEKMKIWKEAKVDWSDNGKFEPYVPHKYQIRFHKSPARVRTHITGNRGGKSISAAMEAVAYMTQPDTRIWVMGETYDICDREWDYILHCITKTGVWFNIIKPKIEAQLKKIGSTKKAETFRKIHNSHPKRIEIDWPIDKKSFIVQKQYGRISNGGLSLEGEKLSGIIMSEGSRIPTKMFYRNIEKRLSDKSGWIILPCTPKGKDDYLYVCYKRGLKKKLIPEIDWNNFKVYEKWENVKLKKFHLNKTKSYWDSYDTINYPAYYSPYYNIESYNSDVKSLFAGELPENIFKERNFGSFVSISGAFFVGAKFDEIFIDSFDLPDNLTHYRSIDPGRAGAAAVLWVALTPPPTEYIVYNEFYKSGVWTEKLAEIIKEKTEYPIQFTVADREITRHTHHSVRSPEEQLKESGIYPLYVPHRMPTTIIDRIELWKPLLMKGKIKIFKDKCPNLVKEIEMLEYKDYQYSGGHSIGREELANSPKHSLDCLTYLFWCFPKYIHQTKKINKEIKTSYSKGIKFEEGSFMSAIKENAYKQKIRIGTW